MRPKSEQRIKKIPRKQISTVFSDLGKRKKEKNSLKSDKFHRHNA